MKSLLENNLKYGKGRDNCVSMLKWLQQLIRIHLSIIVSSLENKDLIESIRKLIHKRVEQRQVLMQIRELVSVPRQERAQKTYQPKFEYVEE